MKALITGASSGIGRDIAVILSNMGYDLVLVARRKSLLLKLKDELKTNVDVISMDVSSTYNCIKLYNKVKDDDIDIVINNAGFGIYGDFCDIKIDRELDMIDLNIKAVHTLTKLFLNDFKKRNKGYILNVASSAAFLPGPLMASYYASKSYVYKLTCAIDYELRISDSNVYVGVLCPGPVDTEFNSVAGVKFGVKALKSYDVAMYGIKKMFKKKLVIIPGFWIKFCRLGSLLPIKLQCRITYNIQKKKSDIK